MGFEISDDYVDVAQRIREFREKHPEGSLQQHDMQFIDFGGKSWCVFTAAAYRTPDDLRPGIGTAWEAVPGATPFTRGSELQNAETAAWGRAIVAALAADTKKIATSDEVQNRQAEREQQQQPRPVPPVPDIVIARGELIEAVTAAFPDKTEDERNEWVRDELTARTLRSDDPADLRLLAKVLGDLS